MNLFEYPPGATPLTNDELHDLIPQFISTQGDLNAAEQMNIAQAHIWLSRLKISTNQMLDELFLRKAHKQMFGNVWKWAGQYRKSDKNIGDYWLQIPVSLRQLLDDVQYQIEHETYEANELAIRFHHRLVWIHPFPNGNGRHARIMTDYLLKKISKTKFSWGGTNYLSSQEATHIRNEYISALRKADKGDYQPLLTFASS